MEVFLFVAIGLLAVALALGMLLSENAVHSALFLIGNFGCVALLFLMLNAPFIGMVQIAVYTGAIMVLFLFVIMLLGAEQTTDTTRQFRWMAGAVTTLAMGTLFALGLPLLLSGLEEQAELPGFAGDPPMVRVVHTADTPPVRLSIESELLAEPVEISPFEFGDVTDFLTLEAGEYTAQVILEEQGLPIANVPLTLERGDMLTVLATGEFSTEAQSFAVQTISNSLVDVGDGSGRLVVVNAYSDETLTLVDPGRDDALDIRSDGSFIDRVVAADLVPGEAAGPVTYPEGMYNLVFVNPAGEIVFELPDYSIEADTEQNILLVPNVTAARGENDPIPAMIIPGLTFATAPTFGSPRGIGLVLFTDYVLPVNMVGLLLLVALIGVVVLTRPEGPVRETRKTLRRRVSRPLVSVISQQTGRDVVVDTPRLQSPTDSDQSDAGGD